MLNNKHSYGILIKIIHSFIFTVMSIMMLEYSKNIPSIQVLFFRGLIGTVILLIVLLITKKTVSFNLSKRSLMFYLSRAAISSFSLLLWIKALDNIGINEAMVLGYITPMWLMLFAIITCKEKLTTKAVIVLALNSLGILIVYQPTINKVTLLGLIAVVITTMLWAFYDIICKKQAKTENTILQSFYFHVFVLLLCSPFAIYWWQPINLTDLAGLSSISLIGLFNIIFVFLGYKFAPILLLIPFSYSRVLFAIMFSYIIYNKAPTNNCIIGIIIILTAELYYYIHEKNSKMRLKQPSIQVKQTN